MRNLGPDGIGFDLGLKFSYPKDKKNSLWGITSETLMFKI